LVSMKANLQWLLTIMQLTILLGMFGCGNDFLISNEEKGEYREIAWNYLTKDEKEQVIGDWRNAEVQIAEYEEKSAVWVTFDSDSFLGPITVIVELKTKEILGTLPRL